MWNPFKHISLLSFTVTARREELAESLAPSCTLLIQMNFFFFHPDSRKHFLWEEPSLLLLPTPEMLLLHHPFSTSCLSSWPGSDQKQYWTAAGSWVPLLHKQARSLDGVQAASSTPGTFALLSLFSTLINSCLLLFGYLFQPPSISQTAPSFPAKPCLPWKAPHQPPAQKYASLTLPIAHQHGRASPHPWTVKVAQQDPSFSSATTCAIVGKLDVTVGVSVFELCPSALLGFKIDYTHQEWSTILGTRDIASPCSSGYEQLAEQM